VWEKIAEQDKASSSTPLVVETIESNKNNETNGSSGGFRPCTGNDGNDERAGAGHDPDRDGWGSLQQSCENFKDISQFPEVLVSASGLGENIAIIEVREIDEAVILPADAHRAIAEVGRGLLRPVLGKVKLRSFCERGLHGINVRRVECLDIWNGNWLGCHSRACRAAGQQTRG